MNIKEKINSVNCWLDMQVAYINVDFFEKTIDIILDSYEDEWFVLSFKEVLDFKFFKEKFATVITKNGLEKYDPTPVVYFLQKFEVEEVNGMQKYHISFGFGHIIIVTLSEFDIKRIKKK